MALNTISISGRLTAAPEIRYTQSDKAVASFTLAVDRDGRDAGTDFINCVAWEHTALFLEKYFTKGSAAIVTGRLQMRNYEDRNGNKRTAAEVVAKGVYFAGEKKTADSKPREQFEEMGEDDGELPF